MKYAIYDIEGLFIQYCNDETVEVLPTNAIALTDEQWENKHYIKREMLSGNIIPHILSGSDNDVISQKINLLWQAAHDYEYQRISGMAIGLLTIGVMQQLPKALAVAAWSANIWNTYYTRKAATTANTQDNLDFSMCGEIPYSVPELRLELGM